MFRHATELFCSAFFFTISFCESSQYETPAIVHSKCQKSKCDLFLTPEHGTHIATILDSGIDEAKCFSHLTMIGIPDYTGFYCPDERLCGMDLRPEFTKELKFLSNKSCSVVVQNEKYCRSFAKTLSQSG